MINGLIEVTTFLVGLDCFGGCIDGRLLSISPWGTSGDHACFFDGDEFLDAECGVWGLWTGIFTNLCPLLVCTVDASNTWVLVTGRAPLSLPMVGIQRQRQIKLLCFDIKWLNTPEWSRNRFVWIKMSVYTCPGHVLYALATPACVFRIRKYTESCFPFKQYSHHIIQWCLLDAVILTQRVMVFAIWLILYCSPGDKRWKAS